MFLLLWSRRRRRMAKEGIIINISITSHLVALFLHG
jgi:hypothetical protein